MTALGAKGYLTLGMTASLTGRYAALGVQALAGVVAWAEDANNAGGILVPGLGRRLPVRLLHRDDESDAGRSRALYQQLLAEGVDILLGPYSSGLALAAAQVAARHGRVLWDHGGALDAIRQAGAGWAIGILTPASRYFHGVIDMLLETSGDASRLSVAIVRSTAGAFPRAVASGAEAHCRARGVGTIHVHRFRAAGELGLSSVVAEVERMRPDAVLAVGRMEDDIALARQVKTARGTVRAFGLVAAALPLFRDALGSAADGFLGPSQWEPGLSIAPDYWPSTAQALASMRRHWPGEPGYPLAQAYAACLVAQRCIEVAGTLEDAALRRAAAGLDFTTFYGRFRIDPATGAQLGHQMPVVQWQRGQKVVVWPPEVRQGTFRPGLPHI